MYSLKYLDSSILAAAKSGILFQTGETFFLLHHFQNIKSYSVFSFFFFLFNCGEENTIEKRISVLFLQLSQSTPFFQESFIIVLCHKPQRQNV
jgi:hypothetical protein